MAKKKDDAPRKQAAAPAKVTAKKRPEPPPAKAGAKPAKAAARSSWLDAKAKTPVIEAKAKQLDSFLTAMADGRIEESELRQQEERLVGLMKEVEPQLDDALHDKVTQLLCELTAYDLMQTLHAMQSARPKTVFRG